MRVGEIRQIYKLQNESIALSHAEASEFDVGGDWELNLSARAYHSILKLARTIQT